MTRPSSHNARGFTLIELLITVVIVGILALSAMPLAELAVQRGKESELRSALRQIREAIDAYRRDVEEGRIARKTLDSGYPPTLDVLVAGVEDEKSPNRKKIYFLRRIPRNPLVDDAKLSNADTWGKRSYASPADDPKAGDDVFDVFPVGEGIGLNGIPYRDW
ncbi:MAG: type II secretion system protein [Burkholderiales bacterium]